MRLRQALRLNETPALALVGAGGKSSALLQLARELLDPAEAEPYRSVLISTTTHLAFEQGAQADRHFRLQSVAEIKALLAELPPGMVLCTYRVDEDERLKGLPLPLMETLIEEAQQQRIPLLIEADGSRFLPLKAPAAHEPALPLNIRQVVVCAGLSALNLPLAFDLVHRPEVIAQLTGLEMGAPITEAALLRLLTHPQGGLKNIPPTARRIVLLNQADRAELAAVGQRLAPALLEAYEVVLVAALKPAQAEASLPAGDVWAAFERVAGVVLAAGGSERMGQPKQTLLWRGEPLVRHVARLALQAGLRPVIVVTGAAAAEVRQALVDLPVQFVHNAAWQAGQGSSVACAAAALPDAVGSAVFLLSDQPQTPLALLEALRAEHARTLAPIVAPMVQGQRGNPVLFDRQTFPALRSLQGEAGGRALFGRFPVTWVPWHDPAALLDVDTPQDYARLQELE